MQSLFSRVRTGSSKTVTTPHSSTLPVPGPSSIPYDEFGREQLQWSQAGVEPKSNGKAKASRSAARQRTLSAPSPPQQPVYEADLPPVPKGEVVFHPLYIPPKREVESGDREYGYLSAENEVILALEDVQRLVAVVGEEILSRAVTTPLLFSTRALDVSANRVRSLVRSFLASCHRPAAPTGEAKWREDARLAGPHELGMILRWGLARLVRVVNGQHYRGLLDWDLYVQWKVDEEALRFPATHITAFVESVPPLVRPILADLLKLFSRLCAYSAQSGLTPIALSTFFGPLLFGLGPESAPFSHTYAAYLRSSHAAEHLILCTIRNVEVESLNTATSMPPRLKDWIRGYPVMISPLKDLEKPRRGSKLIRVASSRRNTRLYTSDLVKNCASWGSEGDMPHRGEWQRITPNGQLPKYSDDYRRRLDIPASYAPSISSFGSRSSFDTPSSLSSPPSSSAKALAFSLSLDTPVGDSLLDATPVKTFNSLNDLRWGEFEELGFSETDSKKLQFNLNEGARQNRTPKRSTMNWNDFSAMGFLREDGSLSETLQFDTPISSSISGWPSHADEIHRKLKKTQKVLPVFGWDTSPVAGQDWTIEEGFTGAWADLLLSTGWADRRETTFRDANWAMVEFKALPLSAADADATLAPTADPRTSTQWFLFEEFVPKEYRDQLLAPPKKGTKGIFGRKDKTWKPATTLNGKPYNGRPRSPSRQEAEFDAMLRATDSKTKIMSLSGSPARARTMPERHSGIPPANNYSVSSRTMTISGPLYAGDAPAVPPKDKSSSPLARFKLTGSTNKRTNSQFPSEYDPNIEFETKTASDSSGGESPTQSGLRKLPGSHSRRQSKDDAWVDILVGTNRRMAGQDAVMGSQRVVQQQPYDDYFPPMNGSSHLRTPRTSLTRARSDPEMASQDASRIMSDYTDRPHEVAPPVLYDDSRTRESISYVGSEEDEEEVMEVPRASVIEPVETPAIRVHSFGSEPRGRHFSEPSDDMDFEAASSPATSARALSPSEGGFDSRLPIRRHSPSNNGVRAISPSEDQLPAPPVRKGSANGNISSLIQMYAKKDEDAAKGIYEPKASKLPIRLGPTVPGKSSPPSPSRTPSPEFTPTPPPPMDDPVNRMINPSPGRYVHGAPLHNVLEEESEE